MNALLRQISLGLRGLMELIISGLAAAALYVAGVPIFAWIMGLVSIVHRALYIRYLKDDQGTPYQRIRNLACCSPMDEGFRLEYIHTVS